MEIWDTQVRLQDARQRVERLRRAYEPRHVSSRPKRPHDGHAHLPKVRLRHLPAH